MADETRPKHQLQIPYAVVTRADVGRLIGEAEAIDNFLRQAAIRQTGIPITLPKSSQIFDEIIALNKLNMLQENDRKILFQFLQAIHSKAPLLHMSFSSDPSPLFQQRLVTWIRQQMHPYLLLQIGLQPNIGAGCVVRSTNKFFDFSLRERFKSQRRLLITKLNGVEETEPESQNAKPAEIVS